MCDFDIVFEDSSIDKHRDRLCFGMLTKEDHYQPVKEVYIYPLASIGVYKHIIDIIINTELYDPLMDIRIVDDVIVLNVIGVKYANLMFVLQMIGRMESSEQYDGITAADAVKNTFFRYLIGYYLNGSNNVDMWHIFGRGANVYDAVDQIRWYYGKSTSRIATKIVGDFNDFDGRDDATHLSSVKLSRTNGWDYISRSPDTLYGTTGMPKVHSGIKFVDTIIADDFVYAKKSIDAALRQYVSDCISWEPTT